MKQLNFVSYVAQKIQIKTDILGRLNEWQGEHCFVQNPLEGLR